VIAGAALAVGSWLWFTHKRARREVARVEPRALGFTARF